MISAKVIAHSISQAGIELVTFELELPTCILAELNTHRMLSRNASSTRAIPTKRLILNIMEDPFIPHVWTGNKPGMQGDAGYDEKIIPPGFIPNLVKKISKPLAKKLFGIPARSAWLLARDAAVGWASAFSEAGYHKQVQGRLLAPFGYTRVIATATDWKNFMKLRLHESAEPHIRILAANMIQAVKRSTPTLLSNDEWHLPYISEDDREICTIEQLIKISVARCARVSYLTHDGKRTDYKKDIELFDMLLESKHMSPFEHVACPSVKSEYFGNFYGWEQYRKVIETSTDYLPYKEDWN